MSKIQLVLTCDACPEQYDAILDNRIIGYLRLRHGCFSVDYYSKDGAARAVYGAEPDGDGLFTDEERPEYLAAAASALLGAWTADQGEILDRPYELANKSNFPAIYGDE